MAAGTVRVKGLNETIRAFRELDRKLPKVVQDELKEAADPVVQAARQKIGRYHGASIGTIRPRATARSVFVRQGARKRSGRRGDFGALQMRRLMEALDENQRQIEKGVEDALDRLTSTF
jgi:hypothetical protein